MSRARDTANTQDNIGGAVAPSVAGKNAVINGAMDIWQRGTSFTTTGTFATSYTADRWQGYQGGGGNTQVTSRQASDLPGFRYFARIQRPSGNTSTAYLGYWTTLETANSIPLAGKTVTLSFYARAGSNMTNSNALVATINSGTGTDQPNYSFTGYTTVATSTVNLLSSGGIVNGWQRYTLTGTVASNMTEVGVTFAYTPTGTASTNDYYDITGVQLEVGSVATPFTTTTGTIQAELAACQRYYIRWNGSDGINSIIGTGLPSSAGAGRIVIPLPVTMRTTPATLDYSSLAINYVNAQVAITTATISGSGLANPRTAGIEFSGASGLTAYWSVTLVINNTSSGYLGLGAEL